MSSNRCSDVNCPVEGMHVLMQSMKFSQSVSRHCSICLPSSLKFMLCISTCMPHCTSGSFHAASCPANTVCMLTQGTSFSSDAKQFLRHLFRA